MKSSKRLKSFIKSIAILLLILQSLVLQSFTPTLGDANSPTCDATGNISCASGTPTCSMGTATCGSRLGLMGALGGPGCNTRTGFNVNAAFCSGNSTSSTSSSTTSGCVLCLWVPDCNPGEELVPATCTRCAYCRPISSTSSTSSSSTSGGGSRPTCDATGNISCASGTPTCSMGTAICGSKLGLMGAQAGPGCSSMGSFNLNAAFCSGTSTSSTSSSTTSSGIICRPPCELICPPCLPGQDCPCRCICSTSSSSSSTSSSSTSGGGSRPTCDATGNISCASGTPTCSMGTAICGSKLGLMGAQAGPGCSSMGSFNLNAAFCSGNSTSSTRVEKLNQLSCLSSNLCPSDRTRFKPCREDETSCKCICQFKTRNKKHTPGCSNADIPVCPGKLTPVCSNPKNKPACDGGTLFCEDIETFSIDLEDDIFCK